MQAGVQLESCRVLPVATLLRLSLAASPCDATGAICRSGHELRELKQRLERERLYGTGSSGMAGNRKAFGDRLLRIASE